MAAARVLGLAARCGRGGAPAPRRKRQHHERHARSAAGGRQRRARTASSRRPAANPSDARGARRRRSIAAPKRRPQPRLDPQIDSRPGRRGRAAPMQEGGDERRRRTPWRQAPAPRRPLRPTCRCRKTSQAPSAPATSIAQQRLQQRRAAHAGGGERAEIGEHRADHEDAQDRLLRLGVGRAAPGLGDGAETAPAHERWWRGRGPAGSSPAPACRGSAAAAARASAATAERRQHGIDRQARRRRAGVSAPSGGAAADRAASCRSVIAAFFRPFPRDPRPSRRPCRALPRA